MNVRACEYLASLQHANICKCFFEDHLRELVQFIVGHLFMCDHLPRALRPSLSQVLAFQAPTDGRQRT